jgi:hypothetical protein
VTFAPANARGPPDDREEVFAVITTFYTQQSRQAVLGMPASRCADRSALRALPQVKGGVSVLDGDITGDVRVVTADPTTFPGTTAWSPPT